MTLVLKACSVLVGAVVAAQALSSSPPRYYNSSSSLPVPTSHGGNTVQPPMSSVPMSQSTLSAPLSQNSTSVPISQNTNSARTSQSTSLGSHVTSTPLSSSTLLPKTSHSDPPSHRLPNATLPLSTSPTPTGRRNGSSRTEQGTESPESESQVRLYPAVPHTVDTKAKENVKPVPLGQPSRLHYGNFDPQKPGFFGVDDVQFLRPTVNLHYSALVKVTGVGSGHLEMSFDSQVTLKVALESWPINDKGGLILILSDKRCHDYQDGQFSYFDVIKLEVDSQGSTARIIARGKFSVFTDIVSSVESRWGYWRPEDGPGHGPAQGGKGAANDFSWNAGPAPGSGAGAKKRPGSGSCSGRAGMPTSCVGGSFDQERDDALGYKDLGDENENLYKFLAPRPGLRDAHRMYGRSLDTRSPFSRLHARHMLSKRGFWSWLWDSIVNTAVAIYKAAEEAVEFFDKALSFDRDYSKQISWALPDPGNAEAEASKLVDPEAKRVWSPWGDSILLKEFGSQVPDPETGVTNYLNIFCVDCGARGKAAFIGNASWSPLHGISKGRIEIDLEVYFGLKIGIDAHMNYKAEFKKELMRVGLPGLSYGAVTVAPQVSLGSRVELQALAQGQLLAGASMGLRASRVVVDIVDPSKNEKSGWEPYFTPVFDVEGRVKLSATLALPMALEFGIAVGEWHKTVAVVEEPSITASAEAAAGAHLYENGTFASGFKPTGVDGACTGIDTHVSWRNKVYLDIVEVKKIMLTDTNDQELESKCFPMRGYGQPKAPTKALEEKTKEAIADKAKEGQEKTKEEPQEKTKEQIQDKAEDKTQDQTEEKPAKKTKGSGRERAKRSPLPRDSSINHPSEISSTPKPAKDSSPAQADATTYKRLVTLGGEATLISCADKNLYAIKAGEEVPTFCSSQFPVGEQDVMAWDKEQRLMHYDGKDMESHGVSRLRLQDDDRITVGGVSIVLGLYPGKDGLSKRSGSAKPFYVAVDAKHGAVFLIICSFKKQELLKDQPSFPKVFVANDTEKGVSTLKSSAVSETVTNGGVEDCIPLVVSAQA